MTIKIYNSKNIKILQRIVESEIKYKEKIGGSSNNVNSQNLRLKRLDALEKSRASACAAKVESTKRREEERQMLEKQREEKDENMKRKKI